MTLRNTLDEMGKAISVRLDDEAHRALTVLEAGGRRRSDVIRDAIVNEARRQSDRAAIHAEYQALEADEVDRAEMRRVAAMMDELRAPG